MKKKGKKQNFILEIIYRMSLILFLPILLTYFMLNKNKIYKSDYTFKL
jgi:hypothetical protein